MSYDLQINENKRYKESKEKAEDGVFQSIMIKNLASINFAKSMAKLNATKTSKTQQTGGSLVDSHLLEI